MRFLRTNTACQSNYMRPATTVNNPTYVPALKAKRVSYCLMRFSGRGPFSNKSHQGFRENRVVVLLSLFQSIKSHVGIVFFTGAPLQIAQSVVRGIVVKVAAFHALWAFSNKGQQDKAMHVHRAARAACLLQANNLSSVLIVGARRELLPGASCTPSIVARRPHCAIVANSISIVSGNVFVCSHSCILSYMDQKAIAA